MKPPMFSPIVQRACKFLKIGNKSQADSPRRKTYKGISLSNEVYQGTCQPLTNNGEGFWRCSLSLPRHWNSASNVPAGEHSGPRSSVRIYDHPRIRRSGRESSQSTGDYEELDKLETEIEDMDEGIFNIELTKPPNGYLGIVLVGGTDTPLQKHYVKDILPNSSAFRAGSLRIGDEIIEVNGHALRGRTHSLALAVIRSLPPVIKLVVERSKDGNQSILKSEYEENWFPPESDPNITSPKARTRKRSVLELANETSVITKAATSVINIQRSTPQEKPAKLVRRESKCTSFIGTDDSEDNDDVIAFGCEETKTTKEGGVPEESNDYDDRLSMLSNTSAWCARQMMSSKQDDQLSSKADSDSIETTSVFSMSTLSDSLPGACSEDDNRAEHQQLIEQPTLTRHDSLMRRRTHVTESIIEVASDEEDEALPDEPSMFIRRGSLRVRGTFSLRGTACEESEEDRTTWPITTRRQRTSLNWDTFVPPPEKPVRRSASACGRRPSSVFVDNNVPSNRLKPISTDQPSNTTPQLPRRTNSGRYIDKKTLTTKVYRVPSTGDWGFTIAGGSYSPYGDLPIHVLDVQDSFLAGVLKQGDEIVSFGGENFSNVTFLEADKKMKNYGGNCVTVIMKRKFLYRKKMNVCNSYADAWNEQAKIGRRLKSRPESLYC